MSPLSLSTLKPARGTTHHYKRVGRGNASGKGTTAGRGTKGQRARTGGRNKLLILGLRRTIMATPKLRGFRGLRTPPVAVNLSQIAEAFKEGGIVNPTTMIKYGLIKAGTINVKILAVGELKKRLIVTGCRVSEAAKEKIVAARGEVR